MRKRDAASTVFAAFLVASLAIPALGQVREVVRELNESPNVNITGKEQNKSYRLVLDAYLELDDPPLPIGPEFNQQTIHPDMPDWSLVSGWAESNSQMAEALLAARERVIFGMPYGADSLPAGYADAGLIAAIGVEGSLRNLDFRYLHAIEVISAYTTAELYRLMEAGQTKEGVDLAIAHVTLLRQLCDRDFLDEKMNFIMMLSEALETFREVLYRYHEKMDAAQMRQVAYGDIPFLRPDRARLFMPEADRIVSKALIEEVFDASTGAADSQKFAQTFAAIQAETAPLTQLGAARRWEMIAPVHASLDDSVDRLDLIYDDWWRRWRIEEYDRLLDVKSQFERCNPIHYAAVIYSIRSIEDIFEVRNQLIAEVNATALAVGICAYKNEFGSFPRDIERIYAQFAPRRSDVDPFETSFDRFRYRMLSTRTAVDTLQGRVWVEAGDGLLYSRGQDHADDRGLEHTDDGASGDIVMWPPMRMLKRQAGLLDQP